MARDDHRVAHREEPHAAKDAEGELRALVRVSAAVAGALQLEDVLEIAAEETRAVLGSSTVAISRWDRPAGLLRTLVNVGELAEGEERWPAAETYPLRQFPRAYALMNDGRPHITAVDDDADVDPDESGTLVSLGKHACLAVPIGTRGRRGASSTPP